MKHAHSCDVVVVTCIDFRIQRTVNAWLIANVRDDGYDRVAIAGGVYDVSAMLKQVEISSRLHQIQRVILMNHEDCGAYGEAGTLTRHKADLLQAKKIINKVYHQLEVQTFYVTLDGEILPVA